jgi:4'-phosphopantetheinyl transferase
MTRNFVDVWYGELLSEELPDQNYWSLLNDDEKDRAKKFTRQNLQKKYIQSRGVLRKILASYLNIEPQNINIKIAEFGKPFLAESTLGFNLSHKDNQFIIAVSNNENIGIDLEHCRNRDNLSALVEKCFSEVEKSYWNALPEKQKIVDFYRFWVRKEAFVKAVGKGISLGLNQCIVNPRDATRFLSIPEAYGLATDWKIMEIQLEKDEICALVVKNADYKYKQMKCG